MRKLNEVFQINEDDVNPFNQYKASTSVGLPTKLQTPQDVQNAWNSISTDIRSLEVGIRLIKSKYPLLDLTAEFTILNKAIADGTEKINKAIQTNPVQKIPAPGAVKLGSATPPPIPPR